MKLSFTAILVFACLIVMAQTLDKTQIAFGFSGPTDIANAGDGSDRLFIVEKAGRIKIIDKNGITLPHNFLDIHLQVGSTFERGLLGLVFHPDYVTNGFFYVHYSGLGPDNDFDSFIARFEVSPTNPDSALVNSEKKLITLPQVAGNHNAGDLAFGPDGYLYISFGDGGPRNCDPQDGGTWIGKMLRIDVNQNVDQVPYYGIPSDNPYVDSVAVLDEIWSRGFRNPWRFSFDRLNGDLWIADVGQGSYEEVSYQAAGSSGGLNYGWPFKEGSFDYPGNPNCTLAEIIDTNFLNPIFEYTHAVGASITGGFVYRGCEYPNLQGLYICADINSNNMWTVQSNGSSVLHSGVGNSFATFGEDEYGELYAASHYQGRIYKIIENTSAACVGCPINRSVANLSNDTTVQSANTVYGLGVVSGSNDISFKSNNIQLNGGFEVLLNAVFAAEIDPCNVGNE